MILGYTNHDYAICQTVLELCNMRDGVSHCDYLNSDDICTLLFSTVFVHINVVYIYCHLTNKDINIKFLSCLTQ